MKTETYTSPEANTFAPPGMEGLEGLEGEGLEGEGLGEGLGTFAGLVGPRVTVRPGRLLVMRVAKVLFTFPPPDLGITESEAGSGSRFNAGLAAGGGGLLIGGAVKILPTGG
jgi:hypothetical protein